MRSPQSNFGHSLDVDLHASGQFQVQPGEPVAEGISGLSLPSQSPQHPAHDRLHIGGAGRGCGVDLGG